MRSVSLIRCYHKAEISLGCRQSCSTYHANVAGKDTWFGMAYKKKSDTSCNSLMGLWCWLNAMKHNACTCTLGWKAAPGKAMDSLLTVCHTLGTSSIQRSPSNPYQTHEPNHSCTHAVGRTAYNGPRERCRDYLAWKECRRLIIPPLLYIQFSLQNDCEERKPEANKVRGAIKTLQTQPDEGSILTKLRWPALVEKQSS